MWRRKTSDEKLIEKEKGIRRDVSAAVLSWTVLLYVLATSPALHGQSLLGVVLPLPQMVPEAIKTLAVIVVLLFFCGLARTHSKTASVLICQKCNRVKLDDGQINCACGGACFGLNEMKWMENGLERPVHPKVWTALPTLAARKMRRPDLTMAH